MILGIDLGGSAIKLAALRAGEVVLCRYIPNGAESAETVIARELERFSEPVGAVALTGVGAAVFCPDRLFPGIPCRRVLEVHSISAGTRYLTGADESLTASIGTGTAFVLTRGGVSTHIGGSAFGGGALQALNRKILGRELCRGMEQLYQAACLDRVDLLMSELPSCPPSLDPKLTAANLVKTNADTSCADWALGLLNMVLQTIGSMAYLAASSLGVKTIVFTGGPTAALAAKSILDPFSRAYGLNFIVPEHSECATAIGAASVAALEISEEA